jgi:hypothetical protein
MAENMPFSGPETSQPILNKLQSLSFLLLNVKVIGLLGRVLIQTTGIFLAQILKAEKRFILLMLRVQGFKGSRVRGFHRKAHSAWRSRLRPFDRSFGRLMIPSCTEALRATASQGEDEKIRRSEGKVVK